MILTTEIDKLIEVNRLHFLYGACNFCNGDEENLIERAMGDSEIPVAEKQCQMILNSLAEPLHVVGSDLRIAYHNNALVEWTRSLNITGEFDERHLKDIFPFLSEQIFQEYEVVFETGMTLITNETSHLDGKTILTETRKVPIIKDGQVIQVMTVIRDITGLKDTISRLSVLEGQNRALIEALPSAIIVTDLDGRIILANSQAARLAQLGSEEEMIGTSIFDRIALDERQLALEDLLKTIENGSMKNLSYTIIRKNGTTYRSEIDGSVIRGPDGLPAGLIFIVRDVTEKIHETTENKEMEQLYAEAPIGLASIRLSDGQFLALNNKLAELLGVPSSNWRTHVGILDRYFTEESLRKLIAALKEFKEAELELILITTNGEKIDTRISARYDEENGVIDLALYRC